MRLEGTTQRHVLGRAGGKGGGEGGGGAHFRMYFGILSRICHLSEQGGQKEPSSGHFKFESIHPRLNSPTSPATHTSIVVSAGVCCHPNTSSTLLPLPLFQANFLFSSRSSPTFVPCTFSFTLVHPPHNRSQSTALSPFRYRQLCVAHHRYHPDLLPNFQAN